MKPVFVRGLGLWTPGYDRPKAWCDQKADPSLEKPDAALLEGPLRRRATPLTRMAVEVFQQAAEHAERGPTPKPTPIPKTNTVSSVWATAYGEHTPAIKLLEMMQRGEGKLSPTHFHNSVHNTASGYASIATGNVAPSTTLTGGVELVASALFEACCLLESSGRDVALVVADEALQAPFDRADTRTPLAIAFLLSPRSERALGVLTKLRRASVAGVPCDGPFGNLHISAALPLLEQIVRGEPGTVALELATPKAGPVWCVDLEIPAS